jgi:mono/diheme cytochrome c family protein
MPAEQAIWLAAPHPGQRRRDDRERQPQTFGGSSADRCRRASFPVVRGEGAAGDASSGATLFADRCAGCHGHDGTGGGVGIRLYAFVRGASRPVDFTDARVMEKWPQERIALVIREGGKAVGASTLMPAYGDRLSKDEISDLAVFINSLRR